MTFSSSMRATASRLIAKYGVDVLYTYVTPGTYDPATGGVSLSTFDFPVRAVVNSAGRELKDGAWVEREGHRLNIAAAGLPAPPKANDQLVFGGVAYLVAKVDATWAGAEVASYNLFVQKV